MQSKGQEIFSLSYKSSGLRATEGVELLTKGSRSCRRNPGQRAEGGVGQLLICSSQAADSEATNRNGA
jgi:hypothetical protein